MIQAARFSTDDLPEDERVSCWIESICETIIDLKVDPRGDDEFNASFEVYDLGSLSAHFLTVSGQNAYRTPQMASRVRAGQLFVQQVRDAPMRFMQFGRELVVQPGECAVIDGRHPYRMEYPGRNHALGFSLPVDWLKTWLPDPEALAAQVWRPGEGWGGVLANSLANITPDALQRLPVPNSLLGDHFGAMLALAAGDAMPPRHGNASTVLLDRLRDTIAGAYQEASLTPAEVAEHHGVSVRHLHLQFAKAGSSFGRELMERRLAGARRMLIDPRFDALPSMEIALRSGFTNASHFARRFRQRFGMSPTQLRATGRG